MEKRTITGFVATQPHAKHLYSRWYQLKGRCYYRSDSRYSQYGGKGIEMCGEWKLDRITETKRCMCSVSRKRNADTGHRKNHQHSLYHLTSTTQTGIPRRSITHTNPTKKAVKSPLFSYRSMYVLRSHSETAKRY